MNTTQRFRKKPVVIEAIQHVSMESGDLARVFVFVGTALPHSGTSLLIPTLEGIMTASLGDWIIRGVKGELYPCKPDIFDATYEAVADDPDPVSEAPAEPNLHGTWKAYPADDGLLSCSYCGSMRPEDMMQVIRQGGARVELADMKYGWPHKFYVDSANLPRGRGKFYTEHLADAAPDVLEEFNRSVAAPRGLYFAVADGRLTYRIAGRS